MFVVLSRGVFLVLSNPHPLPADLLELIYCRFSIVKLHKKTGNPIVKTKYTLFLHYQQLYLVVLLLSVLYLVVVYLILEAVQL